MRRFAVFLATAAGAGFAPIAPGTFGSLVGLVIYLATMSWPLRDQSILAIAVTAIGVWAASVAAKHFAREDPGQVVIDEVAGQLVTLLATGVGWRGAVLGFFLFRAFDIVKPWPAGRFERFHGGTGIMADDVMAGIYANLLLQVAVRIVPGTL
jgi:phosphatidylglycerophosphatase A